MIHNVCLYGNLKKEFGFLHRYDIDSPSEAVQALIHTLKDFKDSFLRGEYRIFVGDIKEENSRALEELTLGVSQNKDIHIIPYVKGSKEEWVSVAIGIVIVAVAIIVSGGAAAAAAPGLLAGMGATAFTVAGASVTFGSIAFLGVSIAIAGVAAMMASDPSVRDYGDREQPSSKKSFLFNGPTNSIEQGGPVPVGFGRMIVGSTQISLGIRTEEDSS